jgi:predicted glycoside hydrolase/deacetylase ChbG (UPF0249 family)
MPNPLLVRADDFGCDAAANAAILDCIGVGKAVRNVSVLACGPAAAERMGDLQRAQDAGHVNIGLHYCINSEWSEVKWGPAWAAAKVPTLVDARGYFTPTPMTLHERGFDLDEAEGELRAQWERLESLGIRPDYLDEHMGVAWLPGLRARLAAFAMEQGIVYRPELDDRHLRVFHPCYRTATTEQFWHDGLLPGAVAEERNREAHLLQDPSYAAQLAAEGFETVTYREFALLYS